MGLLALCSVKFIHYGSEFLPQLNEGSIYVRATLPNSINLKESTRLTKEMKNLLLQDTDEIDFILTQTGRPNDGTDPTGSFNIEFNIQLKDEIIQEMLSKLCRLRYRQVWVPKFKTLGYYDSGRFNDLFGFIIYGTANGILLYL